MVNANTKREYVTCVRVSRNAPLLTNVKPYQR